MKYKISNEQISIEINQMGAELTALIDNKSGVNYLWDGNPAFWKRTSPILFPIVGSLKNQQYGYDGNMYSMSQHGFARDMEFDVVSQTKDTIFFRLNATEDTKKVYPFEFILEIGYCLRENSVEVIWSVSNADNKTMYFSIGGHPAFMCPIDNDTKQTDYYIQFHDCEKLVCRKINENGLALEGLEPIELVESKLRISEHLFDNDALVIEDNQTHKVSLLTPDKTPYITVSFEAPLFGVWSPAKKNAPFICIEPWYGRCDGDNFNGSLQDREWGNTLEVGQNFKQSYYISL